MPEQSNLLIVDDDEDIQRRHHPIIGQSHALQNMLSIVRKAAPTDANVLILGENGTGKELVNLQCNLNQKQYIFALRIAPATAVYLLDSITPTRIRKGQFSHAKAGAILDANQQERVAAPPHVRCLVMGRRYTL